MVEQLCIDKMVNIAPSADCTYKTIGGMKMTAMECSNKHFFFIFLLFLQVLNETTVPDQRHMLLICGSQQNVLY